MKAFILAAGLGTRLQPLTNNKPKALVEIQGKPMLFHIINRLKSFGFTDIVVNVHHFGEQIIEYLNNNPFGVNIYISDERALLCDTGGALLHAKELLGNEPFLVHNVDIFSNADLSMLWQSHSLKSLATLLVSQRNSSRQLLFDKSMLLCGWENLKSGEVKPIDNAMALRSGLASNDLQPLSFSGISVVSPKAIEKMNGEPKRFSIIDFYLKHCASNVIKGALQPGLVVQDAGKISDLATITTT